MPKRPARPVRSLAMAVLLVAAGCAAVNRPINAVAPPGPAPINAAMSPARAAGGDIYVGLAFSGGGMRASSFAQGVLQELRDTTRTADNPAGLLRHVRLVSGVSGGAVTATYFGLYGPESIDRYRDAYLLRNAEMYMSTSAWNPITLARGLAGGVNGRDTFARFLDESIFHGATFADLERRHGPEIWINASDIANNTPFLFASETFAALCSDLSSLPLSEAVAASSAFPLVFSPIVLEAHGRACDYRTPDWLISARNNPEATSALRAYAGALDSYRDPEKVRFVKLLDGGVTDNFGTTGLTIARAKARTPYGPLSAVEAVRLRRILFLVANAGTDKEYGWTQQISGPGGVELGMSIARSAMGAATRVGYDVMRLTLQDWHADLIDWRCGLSATELRRLRGTTRGWDCTDLKLFVGEVSHETLDDDIRDRMNAIPTRLSLPASDVDLAISAARLATRVAREFNGFLRSIDAARARPPAGTRRISPVRN